MSMKKVMLPACCALAIGACDKGDEEPEHEVHWGYEDDNGPATWGDLEPEYATCKVGQEQSPVDVGAGIAPSSHPEQQFHYTPSELRIINNGHVVQVNYDAGSTMTVGGAEYALKQFHFHAGSEHTLGGVQHPLEMHLVHAAADGKLAVVGVLFEEGEVDNAAFEHVLGHVPTSSGDEQTHAGMMIDAAALLPDEHATWRYDGSLTTPPCSEGVSWFVMAETVSLSAAQIGTITSVYGHNFRPTQALGGRTITAPHWAYEGDVGPEHWADLSPSFETCASGAEQSPIDLPDAPAEGTIPELALAWSPTAVTIKNNGHTVQVDYDPGSTLTIDGTDYTLKQFHFHAESEHTIGGEAAPLEVHLVHADASGNLAVVGVLLTDLGEIDNPAFAPVFENLPASASAAEPIAGATVDAAAFLPAETAFYHYAGSLTTPPCSEGVKWFVAQRPVALSAAQVAAFTGLFEGNARPVQPLGGRTIQLGH